MKKPDELSDIVYATVVTLFLLWVIGMMSGCATRHDAEIEKQKIDAINRPLVELKCPTAGCVMSSLTVHNPEQIKLPKETTGWDTANKVLSVISVAIPEARSAYIASEFLKAAINKTHTETHNSNNSQSSTESSTSSVDSNDIQQNEETHITDSYNAQEESHESHTDTYTETNTENINNSNNSTDTTDNGVSDANNTYY